MKIKKTVSYEILIIKEIFEIFLAKFSSTEKKIPENKLGYMVRIILTPIQLGLNICVR